MVPQTGGLVAAAVAMPPTPLPSRVWRCSAAYCTVRAVAVNIEIMRTFVRLRQMIASHTDLAQKLEALERKYDARFKVVFDAIRQLMQPPGPEVKRRPIGFHSGEAPM